MLAVVEDEQQPFGGDVLDQPGHRPLARLIAKSERCHDRLRNELCILQAGELHEPHTVRNAAPEVSCRPQGEPCLAHPTRPDKRHETGGCQSGLDLLQLAASTDEGGQLGGQVPPHRCGSGHRAWLRASVARSVTATSSVTATASGPCLFLPRFLPPGKAIQMLMTGQPITAQEAYRLGMVNEVHPRAELMDAALRIAEQIAINSPTAVQAVKRAVPMGQGEPVRAGHRHHDGGALALGRPPRSDGGHPRVRRGARARLRRPGRVIAQGTVGKS